MKLAVTLIPGDGIGPEVSKAVCQVIEAAGVKIDWEVVKRGRGAEAHSAQKLLAETVESVRRTKVGLKGPIATPIAGGYRSINVGLRQELELYANLRPVKNLKGVRSVFQGVDMVLVRENTEDLYSGVEHTIVPGVVVSLKIITEKASTRIARFAFAYAREHKRRKIHAVHKANIMKVTDGLFLTCIRKVAAANPGIEYHELIVDNTAMQLVLNPHQFDVLLLTNLYGDILSDLAAGLVGGLGVVPSANLGEEAAIFEAVHGTAPTIAGKGIANPTALLLSAVMMLGHLGEHEAARRIETSVQQVYAEGKHLTRDLGGQAGTQELTEAIVQALETAKSAKHPS
jgi:isocitrate dehydrogenase (NAD+)